MFDVASPPLSCETIEVRCYDVLEISSSHHWRTYTYPLHIRKCNPTRYAETETFIVYLTNAED